MSEEASWITLLIRLAVAYLCFDLLVDAVTHYRRNPNPRGLRWVVLTALVAYSGTAFLVRGMSELRWIPASWATFTTISAAGALLVGLLYLWVSRRWGPYR